MYDEEDFDYEWGAVMDLEPRIYSSAVELCAELGERRTYSGRDALVRIGDVYVYVCLQKSVGPLADPRAGAEVVRRIPLTVQKVMVPRAHRRTGLCTELFRALRAASSPDPVRVQSVVSPKMEGLLRKLGATLEPYGGSTWWLPDEVV